MKDIGEVEHLLEQTSVPSLAEGPHRGELKEQLLREGQTSAREGEARVSWFARLSPPLKVAATVLAAAFLVGAGWAAEKVYEKLAFTEASLVLEEFPEEEWKLPNGKTMTSSATTVTVVNTEDPKAAETALRQHEEIKKLVDQKKYELLRTFENEFTGKTEYVYRFKLSDGTTNNMNFAMPLDDVDSWNEYQRKLQEMQHYNREQINRAIAAGKYRLIDQEAMLNHICREESSQQKFRVQRIPLRNGEELALYHLFDFAEDRKAATKPQSSWEDHLRAIRDGKLELLSADTVFTYKYEVFCDDGMTRIFQYGGDEALKPPKAE